MQSNMNTIKCIEDLADYTKLLRPELDALSETYNIDRYIDSGINPELRCPGCDQKLISDSMSEIYGYCCLNEKCKTAGTNPDKYWFFNGKRHREDGPAIERANGTKEWFLNGKRHREDDPAVEFPDGVKEWWENGKLFKMQDLPTIGLYSYIHLAPVAVPKDN